MANILGLFGVTDMTVARRMTLEEYRLRYKAYLVKTMEEERLAYSYAFARRAADAVDDSGKSYRYKQVSDVFDAQDVRDQVLYGKRKAVNADLMKIAMNLREYQEKGGQDGEFL